jgi:lipopolysaccharide transport system ATP-binding protein
MVDVSIKAENLGKKYFIRHMGDGEGQGHYLALRDIVTDYAKLIRRQIVGRMSSAKRHSSASRSEEFWALEHVSFEIKEGGRVGIIGRNGAGKSTLLKILSRIVEPSAGRVTMNGRVASLLEVGTGFHQELTGRENIFFNGSILGMSNQEIKRKFDSIVEFSEIERFLDTPVKRYSSGMYVRLAFAVAAHLEPEILIVDEVLAVGDAEFQAKCLGKMKEVGKEGRTVLFVSHNMNAIEQLCDSCMLIERGRLKRFSHDVRDVIRKYLVGDQTDAQPSEWVNAGMEFENPWFKPIRFSIADRHGAVVQNPVRNDDEIWLQVEGRVSQVHRSLALQYTVYNEDGALLYHCSTLDIDSSPFEDAGTGNVRVRSRIPSRLLNEGVYRIDLSVFLHRIQHITQFGKDAPSIVLVIHGGLSDSPHWIERRDGLLAPMFPWSLVSVVPDQLQSPAS